jgi:hypothetical protein
MPLQSSWVEHWLDRYCEPGSHLPVEDRPGVYVCTQCGREKLPGGATCVICGIPGAVLLGLERHVDYDRRVIGKICGPCLDEFVERRTIRGWTLARAV